MQRSVVNRLIEMPVSRMKALKRKSALTFASTGPIAALAVSACLMIPTQSAETTAFGPAPAREAQTRPSMAYRYHLGAAAEMDRSKMGLAPGSASAGRLGHQASLSADGGGPRASEDGWVTILSDDLESGFPGSNWDLWRPEGGADALWDVWDCWYGDSPDSSAGCAAGGSEAIGCGGFYPNNMDSWMVYGPFSLADPGIIAAELSFNFTLESEENRDLFYVAASIDGDAFDGVYSSGAVPPASYTFDLTNVPSYGNLLGRGQVWIGFYFHSDRSVAEGFGAQVDDVVLRAQYSSTEVPALQISALKNPGRVRSLSIFVRVSNGSGDPPVVTVGEDEVMMSALADSVFLGLYSAASDAASASITATDTNVHGVGSRETTVQF